MKKRNAIFAAVLLAVGVTSCDMEKYPYNSVEESKYMTTLNDFSNARIGLYSNYRGLTTGSYILTQEMQIDDFHAVVGYSNSYGAMYRWDFQSGEGYTGNFWGSYYSVISRCNYFIDSYNKIKDGTDAISESDLVKIKAYLGEAYFTRAYSYLQLAAFFCKSYNAATAESDLGVPLQLTYAPTSDASAYPGRSSMKATYEQILSDLQNAKTYVDHTQAVTSTQNAYNYITQDLVTAMQARTALQMKDYATAISASTSLIEAGKYPLISDKAAFRDMWVHDYGTEVIWQIFMNKDELGSTTGTTFWGQYKTNPEDVTVDYIPSQSLIDLYDQEKDIRFDAFFYPFSLNVSTGAKGDIFLFDKYPGNPEIYNEVTVDNHYVNKSKPFRIAEQYLIAAEAYAAQGNLEGAKYLNDLKRARIAGYTDKTYNSAELLLSDIQDERHKELVGEGFRLVDLKRWGLGVNRKNAVQDANLILQPGAEHTTGLNKAADDFRMVWPIPKSEMDANPQMKGQQNPGY